MKGILIAIIIAVALIISAVVFSGNGASDAKNVNNVTVENGEQVISIEARGGYFPKITVAKAGLPTVIKVSTNNTFDCSSALVIPSLNFRQNLPPVGVTEIKVPAQRVGTKIQGLCAMGMYRFELNFN